MPKYKSQALSLIQSTVDTLANATEWEEAAFVKALELGLEGEKRKNRYEAGKDDDIRRYLQSVAFDTFETSIHPTPSKKVDFSEVTDPEKFFKAYQMFLWDLYEKLHEAANQFVAPLLLRCYARPLYERCDCLLTEITEANRRIKRWNIMKQLGTPYHDLMLYETTDEENIHDRFEKAENDAGYKY